MNWQQIAQDFITWGSPRMRRAFVFSGLIPERISTFDKRRCLLFDSGRAGRQVRFECRGSNAAGAGELAPTNETPLDCGPEGLDGDQVEKLPVPEALERKQPEQWEVGEIRVHAERHR